MRVKEIKSAKASDNGATIVADIEWRTGKVGDSDDLLVSETRTLTVSKVNGVTQVDFHTELTAARDLTLGGDLQHAAVISARIPRWPTRARNSPATFGNPKAR